MKHMVILVVFLISSLVFANADQKLPNGQWAYYSDEFYVTLASKKNFERNFFHRLFNEFHVSSKGRTDLIVPQCSNAKSGCYRHFSVGYDNARKIMFGELDILKDPQGTYVLDVYCGKKFYFKGLSDISGMHSQVNIEHTWPQSKFSHAFPKDIQKSDMHHLWLTDSLANSTRGNSPFGLVNEESDRMGGEGCRGSKMGVINGNDVYTPPAVHRGNVARALFYFSMHYNMPISSSEETVLRRWHKIDPVDDKEIARHEKIVSYQKSRNPFIDYPELVENVSDF
jgi:hypothetical protein